MLEKLPKLLQWIEDVNIDIIDEEVVPGVSVSEFEKIKEIVENKDNIKKLEAFINGQNKN